MRIANFVSRIIGHPLDKIAVMTKKQCVNVATDIGKEFVDISRSGKALSDEVIIKTIQKHVPCVNAPRIVSCENDVLEISEKLGLNVSRSLDRYLTMFDSGVTAWYSPELKAICLPKQNLRVRTPEVLAHELEHFFSRTYTINGIKYNLKSKLLNLRSFFIPKPQVKGTPFPFVEIQKTLFKKFGVFRNHIEKIEGLPSTEAGFKKVLTSDLFAGIKTEKRQDAYIRSVLRHYVHPKFGNTKIFRFIKDALAEETRAYTVSDNVLRYQDNFDGLTKFKIRASLLERMGKIADDELSLAKKYKYGIFKAKSMNRPGLPSEIYAG